MIIDQLAPVIEKQSIYELKPELDNQWRSKGFMYRALISEPDRAMEEEISRAIIS